MRKTGITPCLWFDNKAEEAAQYYTSIFCDSEILSISRFGKEGFEFHGQPEGTAMVVSFRINGQIFTALNGAKGNHFNESVSFQVYCEDQAELDHHWNKLTEGGAESMCGWCKDKFGISWQIIPSILPELMSDPQKAPRVVNAFMQMKKFDIEKLLTA